MVRRNILEGERLRKQACKAPARCRLLSTACFLAWRALEGKGRGTEIQGAGSLWR